MEVLFRVLPEKLLYHRALLIKRGSRRDAGEMWYAIQTITGKEEETIQTIRKVILPDICEDCFLLKREAVWRIQGSCKIHTERLFPGYVFVITAYPQEFYRQLKQVPQYTRILGKEEREFYPISQEEENFLKGLLNGDQEYTVRLSTVEVDQEGKILSCGKPLKDYLECVVKKRIRLRYVVIRVRLFGREREIMLGIRKQEDTPAPTQVQVTGKELREETQQRHTR